MIFDVNNVFIQLLLELGVDLNAVNSWLDLGKITIAFIFGFGMLIMLYKTLVRICSTFYRGKF